MNTRKIILPAVAGAALALTGAVQAKTSSPAEFRGYTNCVEAAEASSNGLVPSRAYFINRAGASAEYFINATRWENGERAEVRIACETVARGARVVSANLEAGRFTNSTATVRVEVAQN